MENDKTEKTKRSSPQPRCELFSLRLKEVLNLVEREKNGNKKYSRDGVSEATGINKQTLTHYTKGQGFPRIDELKAIIQYIQEYLSDFNTDYLLGLSENKTLESRTAKAMFGFDDETTHIMLKLKESSQILAFSKFVKSSNFPPLLDTINKVISDLKNVAKIPDVSTNKLNDALVYGQWLLESEFKFCTAEFVFKDFTKFKDSYFEGQQKVLQSRRDKQSEMIDELKKPLD